MTRPAREYPIEHGPERRAEHGVDDRVSQRRDIPEPDERRHAGRAERLQAAVAGHRQHVDDEERCPQQHEHGENDAEHFGRLALLRGDRSPIFGGAAAGAEGLER